MNKKLSALLCTLLLVLTLTACGDAAVDDGITDDTTTDTVPLTLEDFVKESYDSYDYSDYEGYYLPEDGTPYDSLLIDSDGTRWEIGRAEDLAASGYLQYSADRARGGLREPHDEGQVPRLRADGRPAARHGGRERPPRQDDREVRRRKARL